MVCRKYRLRGGPEIVAQVVEAFGRIDVLVNNAGVAPNVRADLLEMSEESYDRVMEINAKGTMFMTQAVARQMMAQEQTGAKRGTIVNVSSCSCEVVSLNRWGILYFQGGNLHGDKAVCGQTGPGGNSGV